ncbi:MAG: SOS response-associated peptidase [Gordonia sp. (in: high G+C Gram-positive bacteria)]
MCGRYAVTTDPVQLAAEIGAVNEIPAAAGAAADLPGTEQHPLTPNYNVAPTSTIMTVVKRHSRDDPDDDPLLRIRAMRWGLIPPWTTDIGKVPLLFNARAETAAHKNSFRAAVRATRCLVPMDGWYEWKKGPADSRGRPIKVPYFMSARDGTRLFMAGLWSVWHNASGGVPTPSCTILTTEARGDLRDVHDRMPLIMPFADWESWLDPDHRAPASLLAPPSDQVVAAIDIRAVAPLVNRVANNGPQLLEPA